MGGREVRVLREAIVICCAAGKLCSRGWLFWQWILSHSVKNLSSVRFVFTKTNIFLLATF